MLLACVTWKAMSIGTSAQNEVNRSITIKVRN